MTRSTPVRSAEDDATTASIVVDMDPRRQANALAARNLLALVAVLGFCAGAGELARSAAEEGRMPWGPAPEHVAHLAGQVALQASFAVTGMIVAHTVLRHPPELTRWVWLARLLSSGAVLLPGAALMVLAELLIPQAVPVPRMLVALVPAYVLCGTLAGLLLSSHRLRPRAGSLCLLALALWVGGGGALAGPLAEGAPTTVLSVDQVLSAQAQASQPLALLTLGTCFWSGAVVVSVGALVDRHRGAIRTFVPIVSLVGYLIFLPQTLTGASVGHMFLATALAPLMDLRLPRVLAQQDAGTGFLLLGWPTAILASFLVTGHLGSWWGGVAVLLVAVPVSCALGRWVTRPIGTWTRGLRRRRAHGPVAAHPVDGPPRGGADLAAATDPFGLPLTGFDAHRLVAQDGQAPADRTAARSHRARRGRHRGRAA